VLSVAPRSVTLVKRLVRGITASAAADAATQALASRTAAAAEAILARRLADTFGDASLFGDGLP
jgi:signal transduction protein with GAF and PtsI domain